MNLRSLPVIAEPCDHTLPLSPPRHAINDAAALFTVLADPTRLAILALLVRSPRPVCVCDISDSFAVGQPTISHHLKVLREAGLVSATKDGKWVYYSVVQARLDAVMTQIGALLAPILAPV